MHLEGIFANDPELFKYGCNSYYYLCLFSALTLIFAYHNSADRSNNNLVIVGCDFNYSASKSGLFLDDPDPIDRNLKSLGSLTLISA